MKKKSTTKMQLRKDTLRHFTPWNSALGTETPPVTDILDHPGSEGW